MKRLLHTSSLLLWASFALGDYADNCNRLYWKPRLVGTYLVDSEHMPQHRTFAQKLSFFDELPSPKRILGPQTPVKEKIADPSRITVMVDSNLCIRNAKLRYRELLAELSECKGIIDYMDKESIPRARELAEKAHRLIEQYKENDGDDESDSLKETKQKLEPIERELVGISEQILRLMERIDGVAPAHILDAAKLEPWTELDPKLKNDAIGKGLAED
ncbi:hypothetical protein IW138_004656 [Coemansia sp. RSA 986]|nr:hypothetical protein LPJ74_003597 [Coemansia sp. RSA 1843]KAJ2087859.1 hypothetical protein IW138_004656 [Coemansia sp. RSA 986]